MAAGTRWSSRSMARCRHLSPLGNTKLRFGRLGERASEAPEGQCDSEILGRPVHCRSARGLGDGAGGLDFLDILAGHGKVLLLWPLLKIIQVCACAPKTNQPGIRANEISPCPGPGMHPFAPLALGNSWSSPPSCAGPVPTPDNAQPGEAELEGQLCKL